MRCYLLVIVAMDFSDGTNTGKNVNTACFNLINNSLSALPGGGTATSTRSAQVWYKDIGDQAHGGTHTYPFIVQFYEQPLEMEELRINDGEW